jgi:hypothetical protein
MVLAELVHAHELQHTWNQQLLGQAESAVNVCNQTSNAHRSETDKFDKHHDNNINGISRLMKKFISNSKFRLNFLFAKRFD